jgi:predicted flap endonuclease-1-like 5' DNA nuclease
MGFLLAKILFLLVLAAACGGVFAYWWFRRHYEDVTLEYARSRDEWATWRRGFEARLAARPEVDLQPLRAQVAAVDEAVRGIDVPIPERVDLAPLQSRLDDIERRISDIRLPQAPDLTAVEARLTAMEHALFPVQTRLDELASAVRAVEPPPLDLSPVLERLGRLQSLMENPPPAKVAVREGSRNLLTRPRHGRPDDLTQIKGVPKVLARKLHRVGVFYFWQIAEWSAEDVKYVDSKLADYRGRIERDEWVTQANELVATPSAAHRPTEH